MSEILAHATDDRHQTKCGQHSATCTTLPHSSSRIPHVRAHGVFSLCWGELLLSEPVICHPTIPHISAVLPLRRRADWSRNFGRKYRDLWNSYLDTNQSLHFSPQRQFFRVHHFLRRMFADVTDDNTPNKMREARRRVYDPAAQQQQQQQAGPCARALSFLYCGELLLS